MADLRQTIKVEVKRQVLEQRRKEAYWSGDDRRGYIMLFKGFELYAHPAAGGHWEAFVVLPDESKEIIGRFRDKSKARDEAVKWANANVGKSPKQSRMPGFESALKAGTQTQATVQRRAGEAFGDEVGRQLQGAGVTYSNLMDKSYGVRLYGVRKGGRPVSLEDMQRIFGPGKIMDLRSQGQQDTFGVKR